MYFLQHAPLARTSSSSTPGTQAIWKGHPRPYPFVFLYALPVAIVPVVLALAHFCVRAGIVSPTLTNPLFLYGAITLIALVMLVQIIRAHLSVFGATYAIHPDRLEYTSAFGGCQFTLPLSSVRDVYRTRAWWQRLAGTGTVVVSGAAGHALVMTDLRAYEDVHKLLIGLLDDRR